MRVTEIKSCYIGPEISPEQFVAEHFFLYMAKGRLNGFDGSSHYTLHPGEYCLARKNRLVRYNKELENGQIEKVILMLDEAFLKRFQERHGVTSTGHVPGDTFLRLRTDDRIHEFVAALTPPYDGENADALRSELLRLLLEGQPSLADILFDFGVPAKINLEEFMHRNFRFNIPIQRFAYLTGRSLSAFKRDFKTTFGETPSRWLVDRRLQEAHFLLERERKKPSDIYFELGFENLSHFSYAFKKRFGRAPTGPMR